MRGKHGYNGAYFTEPRRERRIGERIRAVLSASRSVSRTAYALGGKANGGGENGGKSRNGTGGEEPSRTERQYIPHEDAFEEADRRALGKLSDDGARRGILSYIRVFSDVRDRDRVQGILSDDGDHRKSLGRRRTFRVAVHCARIHARGAEHDRDQPAQTGVLFPDPHHSGTFSERTAFPEI